MLEREMEELIARFPEEFFPERGFTLTGRQVTLPGAGRFDLVFSDRHHRNNLMELKARPLKIADADQGERYKTALEERGEKRMIVWLVAPMIPPSVRESLDHFGIEYAEIHLAQFKQVAEKHGLLADDEKARDARTPSVSAQGNVPKPTCEVTPGGPHPRDRGLPMGSEKGIPSQAEIAQMPEREVSFQNPETPKATAARETGRKLHGLLHGEAFSKKQFKAQLPTSYQGDSCFYPSDYCYNRINKANYAFCFPLFECRGDNSYLFRGHGWSSPHQIEVLWKPKGWKPGADDRNDGLVVGRWVKGRCFLRYDPREPPAR